MTQLFTNNASGTLSVQAEIVDTTLTLQTNEGQLFPAPTGGDFFQCTLEDTSGNLEVVQCTAKATDVLTVVRAQESTTAKVFPTGSKVELRPTAATHDSFLQVYGGVMQGELDMNNELLTDPLLTGGQIRNSPIRGLDGGTANQIIVPTAGGAPTLGSETIIHTGNDSAYALGATTVTANAPITESGGTLGSNLVFGLDFTVLSQLEGNALEGADEAIVYDDSASAFKAIRYQDASVPVVNIPGVADTILLANVNTFRNYSNAGTTTVTLNNNQAITGNFLILYKNNSGTFVFAGTAAGALEGVATAGPRTNGSVITLVCRQGGSSVIWVVYGDAL